MSKQDQENAKEAVRQALIQNGGRIENWMCCAVGYNAVLDIWQREGFCYVALENLYDRDVAIGRY